MTYTSKNKSNQLGKIAMQRWLCFYLVLFITAVCNVANGDFVIQVGSTSQITNGVRATSGTTFNIEIWARLDNLPPGLTASDFLLEQYQFSFDIATPGFGAGNAIANMTANFSSGVLQGGTFSSFNDPARMDGMDFVAGAGLGFGQSGVDMTNPVKLFDLQIQSNQVGGDDLVVNLAWTSSGTYNGGDANVLVAGLYDAESLTSSGLTSFTLTAVPEPTSIILSGLGLGAFAVYRRRRASTSMKIQALLDNKQA